MSQCRPPGPGACPEPSEGTTPANEADTVSGTEGAAGTGRALTNGSGNVFAAHKSDVSGVVGSNSGSGPTEYRFTGQQDDEQWETPIWAQIARPTDWQVAQEGPAPETHLNPSPVTVAA